MRSKYVTTRWGEHKKEDYLWQDTGASYQYGWLKKSAVVTVIFFIVYGAHISETRISKTIDTSIQYILSTQTDFNDVIEQALLYIPPSIDRSVLKKVQMVVSKPADPLVYMTRPVSGKIISSFGWRVHPISKKEVMYEGIDMEASPGTSVRAAAPGKVKMLSENSQGEKVIILEHSQEIETVYGHLGEVIVHQGDIISQGQIIGTVGKIGMAKEVSLYFELREKGKAVDPEIRMKGDFPTFERK